MINRDEEHLRLLGLYHWVMAGFCAANLLLFILPALLFGPAYLAFWGFPMPQAGAPDRMMTQKLVSSLILGGLVTFLYAMNGWSLKHRRHRISAIIMSVMECLPLFLPFPIGMVLGVSAILVLRRESVKTLFSAAQPQKPSQGS